MSINNKESHLAGARHRSGLGATNTPTTNNTSQTPMNVWTCDICSLTMPLNNKDIHLAEASHRSATQAANAPPTPQTSSDSWMCRVCGVTMAVTDKDSHLATHAAAAQATSSSTWTCSTCGWTMAVKDMLRHLIAHAGDGNHRRWENATRDGVESSSSGHDNSDFQDINDAGVGGSGDDRSGGGQLETAFWEAASQVTAQRLLDLQTQVDIALCDRAMKEKELALARKAWDAKEHVLLLKTDELRAKIVSLDGDLEATKAQCTTERKLRMSAELKLEQEKSRTVHEAETVEGLKTKLKEALDEKQRLTTALARKAESIRTGQSVLSLARTKLSDVTSVRDALLGQTATLTAAVDALRKESATQASQIQMLQRELDLANKRWSSHRQEIADEQLVWKDEEEVEAEKRQQEENVWQAREKLEKMRKEEVKQKAEEEAREKKRAEEKRAREAKEEDERRREAERQEQVKKQAHEQWCKASAEEMHRHREISRTRFQADRGVWTSAKALERFLALLGEFPGLTFSAEQPLTLWSIPWPVLANPLQLAPGKIDWEATEAFFVYAKKNLSADKYDEMVVKAQRTFHPDRWVGKLALILDAAARASLQKIINTVSQVINGLVTW